MFRKIQDFLDSWAHETEATVKVFSQLTDASLSQTVAPEGRTLGRIAWHIVQTLPEMGGRTGLEVVGPGETDAIPETAQEIATGFEASAKSLGEAVKAGWGDGDLEKEDDLYGQPWQRGKTLSVLLNHQNHHRGQMTVLMRQAGLPVPGVYGPSKEEWVNYGMPVQE